MHAFLGKFVFLEFPLSVDSRALRKILQSTPTGQWLLFLGIVCRLARFLGILESAALPGDVLWERILHHLEFLASWRPPVRARIARIGPPEVGRVLRFRTRTPVRPGV